MSTKYHNIPVEVEGRRFPSKREKNRWVILRLMERAGQISDLQRQVSYPVVVNGQKVCRYVADFVYVESGRTVVEDCKGVRTPIYNLKKRLVKAVHGIDILET